MSIRPRTLPAGWYPTSKREVEARLGAWSRADDVSRGEGAVCGIAPHAGWTWSGRVAWSTWRSAADADAIVVVGGHLPAGAPFLYYAEDGFDTPMGTIEADAELAAAVVKTVGAIPDTRADNTVEVHLAMAAARFPDLPVACFRAPADARASTLGQAIATYAAARKHRIFVVGSTDLTHYGASYGFEPGGPAPGGFAWARRADDAIINAFEAIDTEQALMLAERDSSACSVGAAVVAMSYAKALGATSAHVLMRTASDQLAPGADSSVGYCSVVYAPSSRPER
ncbi:MAG TPA: AmmeMemoRadiSam system protein B [bacterium]|nr:AmmeMemoRadiSam system protein B [bacterium]